MFSNGICLCVHDNFQRGRGVQMSGFLIIKCDFVCTTGLSKYIEINIVNSFPCSKYILFELLLQKATLPHVFKMLSCIYLWALLFRDRVKNRQIHVKNDRIHLRFENKFARYVGNGLSRLLSIF